MRHRHRNLTLDRTSTQRQRLVRNLAASLLWHEQVVTTSARARVMRSLAERLITLGKTSDLASRRRMLKLMPNNRVVTKIIDQLGARYRKRSGGFTRQVALGRRVGDGAEQVMVELVK